jgi:thioredoxin reductase (NADPH)
MPVDSVVVGAGPGGLTAAVYLARYLREVLVIDDGRSGALWIPRSHNCPGFPMASRVRAPGSAAPAGRALRRVAPAEADRSTRAR